MGKTDIEKLQDWLDEKRMAVPELAGIIGLTKQAVYHQMKKGKFSHSFILRLQDAGVSPFVSESKSNDSQTSSDAVEAYKKLVMHMEQSDKLSAQISALNNLISEKMDRHEAILQEHDKLIKGNYSRRNLDDLFRNQQTRDRNRDSKIAKVQKDIEEIKTLIHAKIHV